MPKANKVQQSSTELDLVNEIRNIDNLDKLVPFISERITKLIEGSPIKDKYTFLFLFDNENEIRDYTADQIYKATKTLSAEKDILLLISSPGGSIEPAYLISKVFKEFAKKSSKSFNVAIPRKAKSAATLICLGADEIHMGTMSQLGPIDPQIGGLPALGLGNAVEYLANLTKKYPEASDMFAKYLATQLNLQTLGYFERVSESAAQYAEKLLSGKNLPDKITPQIVAGSLVYLYKHHSFVIDKDEAIKFLGETIKTDSEELKLADSIQEFLEEISLITRVFRKNTFSIIGTQEGVMFLERN